MHTFDVQNLTFGYSAPPLFKDWSATIPTGVVLLRCDDSRGKSSLIRLLAGTLPAQAGGFNLDGVTLADSPEQYRAGIFFTEPDTQAFEQITPMDFFALCKKHHSRFDDPLLKTLLDGLALKPHQDKPIYMLSAGSKRKVWIAAALASKARVALIDDLFAALDKASIDFLTRQLEILATDMQDRTLIVAHYDTFANVPFSMIIDI